ncbi:adenylate/guanylate cyclase domain-containing protein [Enhydrobacter sp.]|uniref:adenylate/guanylate cyclase domain-containing protein n=1 Tax=Enhydrobacter sp. TaxID=1894999 RepID=UPI0026263536|nr:adenylate/guanylate cyclase domain-containing protein [Enhydrobacter sp.]
MPDGLTFAFVTEETLLEADLRAGIRHAHACGGAAKCSTCRVRILTGLENCTPRTEAERALSEPLGFSPELRLACQTRSLGDVKFRRLVVDDVDLAITSQLSKKSIGSCGEAKHIAVMFCDIRGFTAFARVRSPYDVMFALNRHFYHIGKIIEANGGYIDKIIGDAVMAIFGLGGQSNAPFRSVKAAMEMLDEVDRLKSSMQVEYGQGFDVGIGIHYGEAVVGMVGPPARESLTAIGDTVNIASRIEAANKEANTKLLISSELYELVKQKVITRNSICLKLPGTTETRILHEISGIQKLTPARDAERI